MLPRLRRQSESRDRSRSRLPHDRSATRRDRGEEVGDHRTRILAAVEAAPYRSQPPSQLITRVDRHQEALRFMIMIWGAYQQCLDIIAERPQFWIALEHLRPGGESQL